jgi:Domain of unknown function (DUF427)
MTRGRVRAYLGGELAADTTSPLLVWEVPYYPAYYIPAGDIRAELMRTGATDHSPSRGDAEIFDVRTPRRHRAVRRAPLRQLADRRTAPGGAPARNWIRYSILTDHHKA